MPTRLIQQHDKFAKQILDQSGNADAFLRERLPAAIVSRLAAKPAIDRSECHLDKVSRELRGDRVFSLETIDGGESLVWAMIEHKSKPESDVLQQMLTDLAGIAAKGARERVGPDGHLWIVPAPVL